jgi:Cof subfamily protein (haloacid dehalogenase superfamily)
MQLLALDLDGTLLRHGRARPTSRVMRALEKWRDCGNHIVVATGRVTSSIPSFVQDVSTTGHIVCSNGAVICDSEDMSPLQIETLTTSEVRGLLSLADSHLRHATVRLESPFALYQVVGPAVENGAHNILSVARSLHNTAEAFAIVKVTLRWDSTRYLHEQSRLNEYSSSRQCMSLTIADDWTIDIANSRATKARGVCSVAKTLGMTSSQVIAIGDMPNDYSLLDWAGRGYLLDNGQKRTSGAHHIPAPGVSDDGVAVVVEALLDPKRRHHLRQEDCGGGKNLLP